MTEQFHEQLDSRQADSLYLTREQLVWASQPMNGPIKMIDTADIADHSEVEGLTLAWNTATGGDFTSDEIMRRYEKGLEAFTRKADRGVRMAARRRG